MSSSVMRQRLAELLDAQVIRQLPDSRYQLTPLGEEARHTLDPLARWAERWAATIDPQGADHTDDPSRIALASSHLEGQAVRRKGRKG